MYIVGIGHRSGMGKDTLANSLVDWFRVAHPELLVVKRPWAWKGKQVAHELYGWLGLREPEFYETEESRALRNVKLAFIDLTPVEIWIKLLSHGVRDSVWDATWVEWSRNHSLNIDADTTKDLYKNIDILIVPDTRFRIEIKVCDYTIKVVNARVSVRAGLSVDDELEGFDDWTTIVFNDADAATLQANAALVGPRIYSDYMSKIST